MAVQLLSRGDFIDVYYKLREKGASFFANRLRFPANQRVVQTWDILDKGQSHWWSIPLVRQRWNRLITGDPNVLYEDYVMQTYFHDRQHLHMYSLGCGTGTHELRFARYPQFEQILAWDIVPALIAFANEEAHKQGLTHIQFETADIHQTSIPAESADLMLFNSSLHHFSDIEQLLTTNILPALKPDGLLVINEYVGPNRLQWTKDQLRRANQLLRELPLTYRKRAWENQYKGRIYRPGWLRMWLADPSEAAESSTILPTLHRHMEVVEEKPFGGNLLHLLFKDIAHNFLDEGDQTQALLQQLFHAEDAFLAEGNSSDFVFGVYRKKRQTVDVGR